MTFINSVTGLPELFDADGLCGGRGDVLWSVSCLEVLLWTSRPWLLRAPRLACSQLRLVIFCFMKDTNSCGGKDPSDRSASEYAISVTPKGIISP